MCYTVRFQDLSNLNRDPRHVVYLTAHPETCAQAEHVLQVTPWKKDVDDTVLLDLFPFLECQCLPLLCYFVL